MHRGLIARKSKESFEQIIDEHITTGLFTSGHREIDRDYVFATVQTLVKDENLHAFAPDAFDYIIIDEAHHAGAKSYQKVLSYFKPKFLLGMTATPERSDDCDILKPLTIILLTKSVCIRPWLKICWCRFIITA